MNDMAEILTAMAAASMSRDAFPELSDHEYGALSRMAQSQGVETVARTIGPLEAADRHATLSAFMAHEVQMAQKRIAALESAQREKKKAFPLKVDVGKYKGTENESLLRWLVEVEAAISARMIEDDRQKIAFAMSNLAGRAKTWAFGRRLADQSAFSSYDELTKELRATFEPPKTEFRARAEFLDLKQGKRDIHAYCQYARYLVSCVVEDPIDDSTQVVAFLKGLTDGPVKTYLFREYPVDLEHAIQLALMEDFSLQQAYVHSSTYRPPRAREMHEYDGAEPMDLSAAVDGLEDLSAADARPPPFKGTCDRCGKQGHRAFECMAPRPVPGSRSRSSYGARRAGGRQGSRRSGRSDQSGQSGNRKARSDGAERGERPKNAAGR